MSKHDREMSRTARIVKKNYDNTCVHCHSDYPPGQLNDSHILQRSLFIPFKYMVIARIPLCPHHDREFEWLQNGNRRLWWMRMIRAYQKSPRYREKIKNQIRELIVELREYKKINGRYMY